MILLKLYTAATLIATAYCAYRPFSFIGTPVKDYHQTVGIYNHYFNKKICAGVIVTYGLVLTSARPMRHYDDRERVKQINVHSHHSIFDEYRTYVKVIKFHSLNKDMWSSLDPFMTAHDMAMLVLETNIPEKYYGTLVAAREMYMAGDNDGEEHERHLFVVQDHQIHNIDAVHVGFGSYSEYQVQKYGEMKEAFYSSDYITYCNQFFPKDWGNFICVYSWSLGCDAGSILAATSATKYKNNTWLGYFVNLAKSAWTYFFGVGTNQWVYGICSFAIKRDGHTVLVFTDLTKEVHRNYVHKARREQWNWFKEAD